MVVAALFLATLLGEEIMKNLMQRPRPFIDHPAFSLIIPTPLSFSFPSGHTTSSFAVAGVLATKIKKYKYIFLILAMAISFSRLYLLVHYPSDVIVGIILGLTCSFIVIKIFTYIEIRKNEKN